MHEESTKGDMEICWILRTLDILLGCTISSPHNFCEVENSSPFLNLYNSCIDRQKLCKRNEDEKTKS
jgi:hypothetical protein